MPSRRNQRTVTQKPAPKPTVTSRSRSQDAGKIARHSSRRSSKTEVELLMECVDDELSPAQLKAIELAQQEHEKANNLIKAARAGNTLVPSSQPNTFTIVPPTPKQAPPQPQPPPPVQAQVPVKPAKNVVASPPAAQQRGLPPPRPPQFMNKQGAASTSADVIVIGETPARAVSKPVSLPQQPSVPVMQGTNVTPKQVYKFVSLPGNQPAQLATNQWVIRPIMTVPPQQQGLITSSTMTQSGLAPSLMQFTNIVPQSVLATSLSKPVTQSPVTTKSSSQPGDDGQAHEVSGQSFDVSPRSLQAEIIDKFGQSEQSKSTSSTMKNHSKCLRKGVCGSVISRKKYFHSVIIGCLYGNQKAYQAYPVSWCYINTWKRTYKCWYKRIKLKVERYKKMKSFSAPLEKRSGKNGLQMTGIKMKGKKTCNELSITICDNLNLQKQSAESVSNTDVVVEKCAKLAETEESCSCDKENKVSCNLESFCGNCFNSFLPQTQKFDCHAAEHLDERSGHLNTLVGLNVKEQELLQMAKQTSENCLSTSVISNENRESDDLGVWDLDESSREYFSDMDENNISDSCSDRETSLNSSFESSFLCFMKQRNIKLRNKLIEQDDAQEYSDRVDMAYSLDEVDGDYSGCSKTSRVLSKGRQSGNLKEKCGHVHVDTNKNGTVCDIPVCYLSKNDEKKSVFDTDVNTYCSIEQVNNIVMNGEENLVDKETKTKKKLVFTDESCQYSSTDAMAEVRKVTEELDFLNNEGNMKAKNNMKIAKRKTLPKELGAEKKAKIPSLIEHTENDIDFNMPDNESENRFKDSVVDFAGKNLPVVNARKNLSELTVGCGNINNRSYNVFSLCVDSKYKQRHGICSESSQISVDQTNGIVSKTRMVPKAPLVEFPKFYFSKDSLISYPKLENLIKVHFYEYNEEDKENGINRNNIEITEKTTDDDKTRNTETVVKQIVTSQSTEHETSGSTAIDVGNQMDRLVNKCDDCQNDKSETCEETCKFVELEPAKLDDFDDTDSQWSDYVSDTEMFDKHAGSIVDSSSNEKSYIRKDNRYRFSGRKSDNCGFRNSNKNKSSEKRSSCTFRNRDEVDISHGDSCVAPGKVRTMVNKLTWYKSMSWTDICYVVILCSHYGLTKMSKVLRIPKTQLLTWRRILRKANLNLTIERISKKCPVPYFNPANEKDMIEKRNQHKPIQLLKHHPKLFNKAHILISGLGQDSNSETSDTDSVEDIQDTVGRNFDHDSEAEESISNENLEQCQVNALQTSTYQVETINVPTNEKGDIIEDNDINESENDIESAHICKDYSEGYMYFEANSRILHTEVLDKKSNQIDGYENSKEVGLLSCENSVSSIDVIPIEGSFKVAVANQADCDRRAQNIPKESYAEIIMQDKSDILEQSETENQKKDVFNRSTDSYTIIENPDFSPITEEILETGDAKQTNYMNEAVFEHVPNDVKHLDIAQNSFALLESSKCSKINGQIPKDEAKVGINSVKKIHSNYKLSSTIEKLRKKLQDTQPEEIDNFSSDDSASDSDANDLVIDEESAKDDDDDSDSDSNNLDIYDDDGDDEDSDSDLNNLVIVEEYVKDDHVKDDDDEDSDRDSNNLVIDDEYVKDDDYDEDSDSDSNNLVIDEHASDDDHDENSSEQYKNNQSQNQHRDTNSDYQCNKGKDHTDKNSSLEETLDFAQCTSSTAVINDHLYYKPATCENQSVNIECRMKSKSQLHQIDNELDNNDQNQERYPGVDWIPLPKKQVLAYPQENWEMLNGRQVRVFRDFSLEEKDTICKEFCEHGIKHISQERKIPEDYMFQIILDTLVNSKQMVKTAESTASPMKLHSDIGEQFSKGTRRLDQTVPMMSSVDINPPPFGSLRNAPPQNKEPVSMLVFPVSSEARLKSQKQPECILKPRQIPSQSPPPISSAASPGDSFIVPIRPPLEKTKKLFDPYEIIEEIEKVGEIQPTDFKIRKDGFRIFTKEFKEKISLLSLKIGLQQVHKHYQIPANTIRTWKQKYISEKEIPKTDVSSLKTSCSSNKKAVCKRKKIAISRELKMKLASLAHWHGTTQISKQFSITKSTLTLWMKKFNDKVLKKIEFTNEELLELVEYVEQKSDTSEKDNSERKENVTEEINDEFNMQVNDIGGSAESLDGQLRIENVTSSDVIYVSPIIEKGDQSDNGTQEISNTDSGNVESRYTGKFSVTAEMELGDYQQRPMKQTTVPNQIEITIGSEPNESDKEKLAESDERNDPGKQTDVSQESNEGECSKKSADKINSVKTKADFNMSDENGSFESNYLSDCVKMLTNIKPGVGEKEIDSQSPVNSICQDSSIHSQCCYNQNDVAFWSYCDNSEINTDACSSRFECSTPVITDQLLKPSEIKEEPIDEEFDMMLQPPAVRNFGNGKNERDEIKSISRSDGRNKYNGKESGKLDNCSEDRAHVEYQQKSERQRNEKNVCINEVGLGNNQGNSQPQGQLGTAGTGSSSSSGNNSSAVFEVSNSNVGYSSMGSGSDSHGNSSLQTASMFNSGQIFVVGQGLIANLEPTYPVISQSLLNNQTRQPEQIQSHEMQNRTSEANAIETDNSIAHTHLANTFHLEREPVIDSNQQKLSSTIDTRGINPPQSVTQPLDASQHSQYQFINVAPPSSNQSLNSSASLINHPLNLASLVSNMPLNSSSSSTNQPRSLASPVSNKPLNSSPSSITEPLNLSVDNSPNDSLPKTILLSGLPPPPKLKKYSMFVSDGEVERAKAIRNAMLARKVGSGDTINAANEAINKEALMKATDVNHFDSIGMQSEKENKKAPEYGRIQSLIQSVSSRLKPLPQERNMKSLLHLGCVQKLGGKRSIALIQDDKSSELPTEVYVIKDCSHSDETSMTSSTNKTEISRQHQSQITLKHLAGNSLIADHHKRSMTEDTMKTPRMASNKIMVESDHVNQLTEVEGERNKDVSVEESSRESAVEDLEVNQSGNEETLEENVEEVNTDLTEKLRSLLNADIFNVIGNDEVGSDAEQSDNEDEDLIEILASSGKKDDKVKQVSDDLSDKTMYDAKDRKLFEKEKSSTIENKPKIKRFKYSNGLKMKLAKLADTFSYVQISMRYGVCIKNLKSWSSQFRNIKCKSLEFTDMEDEELIRLKQYREECKKDGPQYQIYIDNPEPETFDDDDNDFESDSPDISKKKITEEVSERDIQTIPSLDNTLKQTITRKSVDESVTVKKADTEILQKLDSKETETYLSSFKRKESLQGKTVAKSAVKDSSINSYNTLSPRNPLNIGVKNVIKNTSAKSTVKKVETLKPGDIPLYLAIPENVSNEEKEKLRQKFKSERSAQDSVFMGSPVGTSKIDSVVSSSSKIIESLEETGKTGDVEMPTSTKDEDLDFTNIIVVPQRNKSWGASKDKKENQNSSTSDQFCIDKSVMQVSDAPEIVWSSSKETNGKSSSCEPKTDTVAYLCPTDGIFKFRDATSTNKISNVLETALSESSSLPPDSTLQFTPDGEPIETVFTDHSYVSPEKQNSTLTVLNTNKTKSENSMKDSLTSSAKSETMWVLNGDGSTTVSETALTSSGNFSFAFKAQVVEEAKKSGFENTAKWYNIPMTDIMKWHDAFFTEQPDENYLKAVVKYARQHGVDATAKLFPVSKAKIAEWLEAHKEMSGTHTGMDGSATKAPKVGLSFETIQGKHGSIVKPKFGISVNASGNEKTKETVNWQKTRMGPNAIRYTKNLSQPHRSTKLAAVNFQQDVAGDLGAMPRIVKQNTATSGGLEIASTWKQIQSIINPPKSAERKYSIEFKNRIIKECLEKGQKLVAKEHRIPYNEISRWRLEGKKLSAAKKPDVVPPPVSAQKLLEPKQNLIVDPKRPQGPYEKDHPTTSTESLKITIKLSKNPEVINLQSDSNSHKTSLLQSTEKVSTTQAALRNSENRNKVELIPGEVEKQAGEIGMGTSKVSDVLALSEPITCVDEDSDLRMRVINYCFEHGVLKTQKQFSVTRQSVIDLMKEYDELNKYSVDAYNRDHGFKTKLVSREKTSVEVTNAAGGMVLVNNLQDHIVTPEYKQDVVEYARKHGITAATRKFKRKTATVKTWMAHHEKIERNVKRMEEAKTKKNTEVSKNFGDTEYISDLPRRSSVLSDSISKSPSSQKSKPSSPSPIWDQDFVIKPSTGKSPLKLTLSPRRKSQVINIISNDDETNDIETEDEEIDVNADFEEVASWDLGTDEIKKQSFSKIEIVNLLSDDDTPKSKTDPVENITSLVKETPSDKTVPDSLVRDFSTDEKEMPTVSVNSDKSLASKTEIDSSERNIIDIESELKKNNQTIKAKENNEVFDKRNSDGDVVIRPTDVPNIMDMCLFEAIVDSSQEPVLVRDEFDKDLLKQSDLDNNETNEKLTTLTTGEEAVLKIEEQKKKADTSENSLNKNTNLTKISYNIISGDGKEFNKDISDHETDIIKEKTHDEELRNTCMKQSTTLQCQVVSPEASNKLDSSVEGQEGCDIIENIPYEETVMFKLLTEDVDKFFTNVSPGLFSTSSNQDKSNEMEPYTMKEQKQTSMGEKKKRRNADFEIMENIEETCLFIPSRFERHTSEKETSATLEEENEIKKICKDAEDSNLPDDNENSHKIKEIDRIAHEESKLQIKEVSDAESNDQILSSEYKSNESHRKTERSAFDFLFCPDDSEMKQETSVGNNYSIQATSDGMQLMKMKEKTNADFMSAGDGKEMEETNTATLSTTNTSFGLFDSFVQVKQTVDTDSQKIESGEEKQAIKPCSDSPLSLFGNLMKQKLDVKLKPEAATETEKHVEKSNSDATFGLFGSLIKSFKIPATEAKEKEHCIKQNEEESYCATSIATGNSLGNKNKENSNEIKSKDRSERNVFDFMTPEHTMAPLVKESPKLSPLKQDSPKSVDLSRSPMKPSSTNAAKRPDHIVKKPMFKFPKFALPVNFGNIAKLGMAKFKQDEKAKSDKTIEVNKAVIIENSDQKPTETKTEVDANDKTGIDMESKETIQEKVEAKVTIETKTKSKTELSGVVMETFEELRQRLALERAANRIEKEKQETVNVIHEKSKVEDGTLVSASSLVKNVDYEMYKEFTPQKIVLILDISKKHGIEFASTSFGLPVSVIINWIIEKDRKHRRSTSSSSIEDKLMAVRDLQKLGEDDISEVATKYAVETALLVSWKQEVSWLFKQVGVVEVLEKWEKIQSVSNLCLDEIGKKETKKGKEITKVENDSDKKCTVITDQINELDKISDSNTSVMLTRSINAEEDSSTILSKTLIKDKPLTEDENDFIIPTTTTSNSASITSNLNDESVKQRTLPVVEAKELVSDDGVKVDGISAEATHQSKVLVPEDTDVEKESKENKDVAIDETKTTDTTLEHALTEDSQARDLESSKDMSVPLTLPEVLSFTKTLNPRDYSTEQKAMIVLLLDKYGIKDVHHKLGINKGTLWTWKNQNKVVKNFILEQTEGVKRKKKITSKDKNAVKKGHISPEKNSSKITRASEAAQTRLQGANCQRETSETLSKQLSLQSVDKNLETRHCDLDQDHKQQHKGYRQISPTKLPETLRDARKIPTKNFTLEQRVAIVRLVELYGVRTIHKQFRIPSGSIWNWQHNKQVTDLLKQEKNKDDRDVRESSAAKTKKNLKFDNCEIDDWPPLSIDAILDNVLVSMETTNHLGFKLEQKADVVCLINHFGLDYVCEKIPQVPRGTIWNWCRNKNIASIVDRKTAQLKKVNKDGERNVASDNEKSFNTCIGETSRDTDEIDKAGMTQRWLNAMQNTDSKSKRKHTSEMTNRSQKKWKSLQIYDDSKTRRVSEVDTFDNEDYEEIGADSDEELASSSGLKSSFGLGIHSASINKSRPIDKHNCPSPSTVSSLISEHSNDFEEILSDDEVNTSSIYSRKSETSIQHSLSSRTSRKTQKSGKEQQQTLPNSVRGLLGATATAINPEGDTEQMAELVHELLNFSADDNDRMMVCYRVLDTNGVPVQSVGRVKSSDTNKPKAAETPGGLKRTASDADLGGAPASKKKTPTREKGLGETDSSGNWVPLDEYYYGTMEGDKAYTEEKGEFRFKCWYCSKMLYNNVRAMQHIQGHIDSSKQQNIDLSDLTQCKHCYKQFDTPFEMQTHVEKVHLSNKVLMCRICEKDMSSQRDLTQHMRQNHKAYEMPYVCQLCNFKSSMYSDVVDHFKKKHDSSNSLLCLYCLRTFDVKFVSQGWGQTQTYYGHLLKHQSKSSAKKCVVCRLTFFNANDVKNHRKNHHVSNHKGVHGVPAGGKFSSQDPVMIKVADSSNMPPKTGSSTSLKSLNAPSVSKMQDYGDVKFPGETKTASCFECKMTMSSTDHYKKYINCSMCRFATSCSVAYANHMMGFHSGQMSSLNLNIPWECPMSTIMYCSCGFSTKYGNKIANHLVSCSKSTCFYNKPDQSVAGTGASTTSGITDDDGKESDGSLLGVLGLVQKRTVTTRGRRTGGIRTSSVDAEPLESKSDMPDVKKKRGGSRPGPKSKRGRSRTVSPAPAKVLKSSKPDKTFKDETSKAKDEEEVVELVEETAENQTEPIKNKSDISSKQDMESITEDGKLKDQSDEMEEESAIRKDGKGSGVIGINKIDILDEKSVAASNIKSRKDHPAVNQTDNQTDTTLKTNMSEESISASIGSNIQGPAVVASGSSDNIDDKDSDSKKNSSELDKGAASEKSEESNPIEMDDAVEGINEEQEEGSKDIGVTEMDTDTSRSEDIDADMETESNIESKEIDTDINEKDDNKSDRETISAEEHENVADMIEEEKDSGTKTEETDDNKDIQNDAEVSRVCDEIIDDNGDKSVDSDEKGGKSEVSNETVEHKEEKVVNLEEKDTAREADKTKTEQNIENEEIVDKGKDETKPERKEEERKTTQETSITSDDQSSSKGSSQGCHGNEQGDHHGDSQSTSSSSLDRHRQDHDKHRHDDRSQDDRSRDDRSRDNRSRDDRSRDNRSHGSHRSDSHHGNKSSSYDRNRDRPYDRDNRGHGDFRSGYGYHGNQDHSHREQSQGGGYRGQPGQYGGHHGNQNRGGYNRDQDNRGYNRNYNNRGGYNQNYRGGYHGGRGGYY